MSKIAVVLMNLGGPKDPYAIEPFLFNLFSDPDIFKIPIGQKIIAKIIAKLRAPKVAVAYGQIGGASPIIEWTEKQREKLERLLNAKIGDVKVFTAFRYSPPFTETVTERLTNNSYEKIILLPLYPHYSYSTTGSSFNEWKRNFKGDNSLLFFIENFYLNDKYIKAVSQRIREGLNEFKTIEKRNVVLLFSAHGTPVSMVKAGDPYSYQIKESVDIIMNNFPNNEYSLCYQSKVGPVKWLGPSIKEMLTELANKGKKYLLVIPISFVSDHFETLYELNIFYRRFSESIGIKQFRVTRGLNDLDLLIEALAEEVIKKLEAE